MTTSIGGLIPTRSGSIIGHASIDSGIGYTYSKPHTGIEFSAVTGLTYNWESPDTDFATASIGISIGACHIGAVGYFYNQLTADSEQLLLAHRHDALTLKSDDSERENGHLSGHSAKGRSAAFVVAADHRDLAAVSTRTKARPADPSLDRVATIARTAAAATSGSFSIMASTAKPVILTPTVNRTMAEEDAEALRPRQCRILRPGS